MEETLPPLDELQRYNAAAQSEEAGAGDLSGLIQNLQTDGGAEAVLPKFAKGDRVVAVEGEQQRTGVLLVWGLGCGVGWRRP